MTAILISSGFLYVETLKEFSQRFTHLPPCEDAEFDKILICPPVNPSSIDVSYLKEKSNRQDLLDTLVKRLNEEKYAKLKTQVEKILDKLLQHFDVPLTVYIVKKCFLFYNWRWNAIEVLTNEKYVHRKISVKCENKRLPSKSVFQNFQHQWAQQVCATVDSFHSSVGQPKEKKILVPDKKGTKSRKRVSLKAFKEAVENAKLEKNLRRSKICPLQETFNLNKMLYDCKVRSRWPKNHILAKNDVNLLLAFIVDVNAICLPIYKVTLPKEIYQWTSYKNFLQKFLNNHLNMEKNNGYGRILKRHLKTGHPEPSNEKPVAWSVVASYIVDILRRVIPSEFYDGNRMKKKFFSSVTKILKGRLKENFIWQPYVEMFVQNRTKLLWCRDMPPFGDTQTLMILKTFKFFIIHYVFVVVKNNFYVTETGTSGYGLKFYTKKDIETASKFVFDFLVCQKRISLFKRRDEDIFTMERQWVDTGVIDGIEVRRQSKVLMDPGTEFKQPIASVRILPKKDLCRCRDVRIITCFPRRVTKFENISPESSKLPDMFKERASQRERKLKLVKLFLRFLVERLGTGMAPVPQNPRLQKAWSKAVEMKRKLGRVYFVKADVTNAFDCVLHDKLLRIVRESIREAVGDKEFIRLRKITEWSSANGQVKKQSRFSFSERPKENSILVDRSFCCMEGSKSSKYKMTEFVNIIEQVALKQRLQFGGKIMKLSKGVAQGSAGKLSPQLCEIYYSAMDRSIFGEYLQSDDCILMRGVDDYLLITSSIDKAKGFFRTVYSGIPDFNAKFSGRKLTANFLGHIHEIRYLGLTFNFDSMSVRPDYSKYEGRNVLSTMKLSDKVGDIHFKKEEFFRRRVMRLSTLKLHPILLNGYNSASTIRETIYQACVLQSLRILSLADYLFRGKNTMTIVKVLFRIRQKLIKLTTAETSVVSSDEISGLFFRAVVKTITKRSGQFQALLRIMRFHLQRWEGKVPDEDQKKLRGEKRVADQPNWVVKKKIRLD